jgi:transcription-repair coupling factor (superfamily II helicase)
MSLSGIRDMSVMNDPPEGRVPIKTYCREYEDELVRDAILRELDRDGQIYFVHNRVENIEHIGDHLRNLVPYARIRVGHGQMHEDELESVMLDFYEHKYDVLLCTTIIESGLDIPNVNTIIVNNADKMGLAQLYQLRGRVGRSNRQAYAYLLYKADLAVSETAEKRLQAIREFSDLGSGFRIAIRDLEIRGAGNLLGAEQHGHMSSVGFDMYCQLLAEAVREVRGEEPSRLELPPVDLPMDAHIPVDYIPSESLRLSFYKKMTAVRDEGDIEQLAEEMKDRFGELPKPAVNSLDVLRLRLKAASVGMASISMDRRQVVMRFGTGIRLAPDIARELKKKHQGCIFTGDRVLIHAESLRLLKLIGYILDDLPAALEESKDIFLANLY